METTELKTNGKLASELKALGFDRGLASWEKSEFRKAIATKSMWQQDSIIRVDVKIRNQAIRGNDWIVDEVSMTTKSFDGNSFTPHKVDLTQEAQDQLFELLGKVRAL